MAIVSNPLIGASKQKLGGVVFSSWKGKNVLKGKPLSVANPKSLGQRKQRLMLASLVAIYRLLAVFLKVSFYKAAVGKSEYNVFVGKNLKNGFVTSDGDTVTFDYTKLDVSGGNLPQFAYDVAVSTVHVDDETVTITWDHTLIPAERANDVIGWIVFVEVDTIDEDLVFTVDSEDDTVDLNLASAATLGQVLNIYCVAKDPITGNTTLTKYLTTTVVA